jgi:hypothetical protein
MMMMWQEEGQQTTEKQLVQFFILFTHTHKHTRSLFCKRSDEGVDSVDRRLTRLGAFSTISCTTYDVAWR